METKQDKALLSLKVDGIT
ncbi:hypothetical protein O9992_26215 [Vibrio lentus]|nr:hypothetical protein [Vibrio lentus]